MDLQNEEWWKNKQEDLKKIIEGTFLGYNGGELRKNLDRARESVEEGDIPNITIHTSFGKKVKGPIASYDPPHFVFFPSAKIEDSEKYLEPEEAYTTKDCNAFKENYEQGIDPVSVDTRDVVKAYINKE